MRDRRLLGALCTSAALAASVGIVVYADVMKEAGARFTAKSATVSALRPDAEYGDQGARGGAQPVVASIGTDKFDYKPGETARISGAGFQAFESVTLEVDHVDGRQDGEGHEPFFAFADQDGRVNAEWLVNPDDSLHAVFVLTAAGATSGRTATTIFTDSAIMVVDDQGADDYPGQKDLNFLTVDYAVVGKVTVTWGWDDTAWSGNNTGDACVLFDTGGNPGFANYAMCATVEKTPAVFKSVRLYSCGDSRADRCDQPNSQIMSFSTAGTGALVVANADPFGVPSSPYYTQAHTNGNKCDARTGCYRNDTVATVVVNLADVGATAAKLINVCSYPSQIPNSAPSECVITPDSGFLTIVKVDTLAGDTTKFTFNSSAASQGGVSSWDINGSGSQSLISFPAGTYNLNEAIPAGWTLDSASCALQTLPTSTATGTPLASPVNGSANAGVSGFTIQAGLETVCTFTDSKRASLKLVKEVINNNGGTAAVGDFVLKANGTTFTSGVSQVVAVGTYALTEVANVTGYNPGSWVCTGGGTQSADGTSVTIAAGENVTCTIINNDIAPSLTLNKILIKDNGGTANESDWTLSATGTGQTPTNLSGPGAAGSADVVSTDSFKADTYTLAESSGPTGYTASAWTCTNGVTVGADNKITRALAQSTTCSITNNDESAHLIIKKVVVNDNGGSKHATDFKFKVNGGTATTFIQSSDQDHGENTVDVSAGNYSVVEDALPIAGYETTYDNCSGAISSGETKTCTITNNDVKAGPAFATVQSALLFDTATFTGLRPNAPGTAASVTFSLWTTANCAAGSQVGASESRPISIVNNVPTATKMIGVPVSGPVGTTGTYYWKVEYSGDQYNESKSECGTEKIDVKFVQ
jgi:hypothetical protein